MYVEMRPLCASCARLARRRRSRARFLRWGALGVGALALWGLAFSSLRPGAFRDPKSWGRHAGMIHALRDLLRADPCDGELLLKLSVAYEAGGDPANAHDVLQNAVGRCDVPQAIDERLLRLHTAQASWASAVDDATRLIAREPTIGHLRARARLELAAGEPGLAAIDYRRILRRAPDDLDAREGMARYQALLRDGDYLITLTDSARRSHP
jgi:tetratricopeptide (TPR) repeat protein